MATSSTSATKPSLCVSELDKSEVEPNCHQKSESHVVPSSPIRITTNDSKETLYGVLYVFGYNASFPIPASKVFANKYYLFRREKGNGVKPDTGCVSIEKSKRIRPGYEDFPVPMKKITKFRKYIGDDAVDMFQLGRSSELPNDFIVLDTVPNASKPKDLIYLHQSNVSRFACRLMISREPPHTVRIYASGFNKAGNIYMGDEAIVWQRSSGFWDGLTTNGVLMLHQQGPWGKTMMPGIWREVSVAGDVYGLRYSRSLRKRGRTINETNVLQDGSMIDLCGTTLLWRTAEGIASMPTEEHMKRRRQEFLSQRPKPSSSEEQTGGDKTEKELFPLVHFPCGHCYDWENKLVVARNRYGRILEKPCPICRKYGPVNRTNFGREAAFYVDDGPLTHCFCPCGHITTEATIRFWERFPIPHNKEEFRAACPFCAVALEGEEGYAELKMAS